MGEIKSEGFSSIKSSGNICVVPVIFVVEASERMFDGIGQIANTVISKLSEKIHSINMVSSSVKYEVAVLGFSSEVKWYTDGLVAAEKLYYSDGYIINEPISGDGKNLGSALRELNRSLSYEHLLYKHKPYLSPIICFITNGKPTDDYETALCKISYNYWFEHSTRFSLDLSMNDVYDVLYKLCGDNSDAVVSVGLMHNAVTKFFEMCQSAIESKYLRRADVGCDDVSEKGLKRNLLDVDFGNSSMDFSALANQTVTLKVCHSCGISMKEKAAFCPHCGCVLLGEHVGGILPCKDVCYSLPTQAQCSSACIEKQAETHYKTDKKNSNIKRKKSAEKIKITPSTKNENNVNISISQVEFSAVVPKNFVKGEYSTVEISLYEETYRHIVERIIRNAYGDIKEIVSGVQEIEKNTEVKIVLSSPDLHLQDCDETQVWKGKYLNFSFLVTVPENYLKKHIVFVASVYFDNIIATKLKFVAKISSWKQQKIDLVRDDVLTAFISYASQDRDRVASIIQGMQKARPDMDVFLDVEKLRSGENWENALKQEIEKRDVLYLCWSEHAKTSSWVETEWRYALTNKGLDAIEPIPLVSPNVCPPPDELKSKHFNDKILYFIQNK